MKRRPVMAIGFVMLALLTGLALAVISMIGALLPTGVMVPPTAGSTSTPRPCSRSFSLPLFRRWHHGRLRDPAAGKSSHGVRFRAPGSTVPAAAGQGRRYGGFTIYVFVYLLGSPLWLWLLTRRPDRVEKSVPAWKRTGRCSLSLIAFFAGAWVGKGVG